MSGIVQGCTCSHKADICHMLMPSQVISGLHALEPQYQSKKNVASRFQEADFCAMYSTKPPSVEGAKTA